MVMPTGGRSSSTEELVKVGAWNTEQHPETDRTQRLTAMRCAGVIEKAIGNYSGWRLTGCQCHGQRRYMRRLEGLSCQSARVRVLAKLPARKLAEIRHADLKAVAGSPGTILSGMNRTKTFPACKSQCTILFVCRTCSAFGSERASSRNHGALSNPS